MKNGKIHWFQWAAREPTATVAYWAMAQLAGLVWRPLDGPRPL
jgi:hypothetical protein